MDDEVPMADPLDDDGQFQASGLRKEQFEEFRQAYLAAVAEILNNRLEDGVDARN